MPRMIYDVFEAEDKMMKIDLNAPLKDVIATLRSEITERQTALKTLEDMAGITQADNGTGGVVFTPAPTISRTRRTRTNSTPSMADHAKSILEKRGTAIPKQELREALTEIGVDTTSDSFFSTLHTALIRKPNVFSRAANGDWQLREWEQQSAASATQG